MKEDNFDIYVKEVDGTGFNRLTTDPAEDTTPAWSRDGRNIAFARVADDRWALHIISVLGGEEQKLTEYRGFYGLSWSVDGKEIAIVARESPTEPNSIWSLVVTTRAKEKLTNPPAGFTVGDYWPACSPDGHYPSFIRRAEVVNPALYVMRLSQGDAKLVTDYDSPQHACWTADSREIVYSSFGIAGGSALWRVAGNGGQPRRIPARGDATQWPSVRANRLAYGATTDKGDIFKLDLTGNKDVKRPSGPLLSWTTYEESPHISPDGTRIVFTSDQSGNREVWICDGDGTKPEQLTDMRAAGGTGSPRWSPDGRLIAFDSTKYGSNDIHVVRVGGGEPRRLTTEATEEGVPRWSRDGRWIYFGSNRSGSMQLWRMPSEGGRATQITRDGGLAAVESADRYLYYSTQISRKKGVWRVPASGGQETLVTDAVSGWQDRGLTDRGIYIIDSSPVPVTLLYFDFAAKSARSLARIRTDPAFRAGDVRISADGKWLVYHGIASEGDIMLIDNFR